MEALWNLFVAFLLLLVFLAAVTVVFATWSMTSFYGGDFKDIMFALGISIITIGFLWGSVKIARALMSN